MIDPSLMTCRSLDTCVSITCSDAMYHWQSHRAPPSAFCFDPIFELYLGCWPVVFPLITRRKLSIKSVKWDAMSGLNGWMAICSNSAAFKVLTVCFLGPYVTINLRLGSAALKNEKPDCFCLLVDDDLWFGAVLVRWGLLPKLSPREPGCVTVFRNNFFNWFCN